MAPLLNKHYPELVAVIKIITQLFKPTISLKLVKTEKSLIVS